MMSEDMSMACQIKIQALEDERDALRQRVDELEDERDALRGQVDEHLTRIRELEAENRSLEDALEEERRRLDQAISKVREREARIRKLEAEPESPGQGALPRVSVRLNSVTEAQVARVGQQVWDLLCAMGTDGVGTDGSEHLTDLMIDIATAMGKLKAG